jgi:hypothetical protein
MFKSRGEKNFNGCGLKTVEAIPLSERDSSMVAVRLSCPKTEDTETPVTVRARDLPERRGYMKSARGTTPIDVSIQAGDRREWVGSNVKFNSLSDGAAHLAVEAGRLFCGKNCEYYGRTRLEVSEIRAVAAEEELAIAQNELRLAEAVAGKALAYEAVNALGPLNVLPELPPAGGTTDRAY